MGGEMERAAPRADGTGRGAGRGSPICGDDMKNGKDGRCRYTLGMKRNAAGQRESARHDTRTIWRHHMNITDKYIIDEVAFTLETKSHMNGDGAYTAKASFPHAAHVKAKIVKLADGYGYSVYDKDGASYTLDGNGELVRTAFEDGHDPLHAETYGQAVEEIEKILETMA